MFTIVQFDSSFQNRNSYIRIEKIKLYAALLPPRMIEEKENNRCYDFIARGHRRKERTHLKKEDSKQ
jgi:hypothetical protein